MKISSTAHRIAVVLAGIAVLAALGGVAQGATSTSRSAGMSKAEYRAMMIRGEALNQKYRIGAWKGVPAGMTPAQYRAMKIRGEALDQKYGLGAWKGVPAGMTPPQYRAMKILGEALNKKYGLGRGSTPAAAAASTAMSHGFAWGAFGIGAVAMLGLALLAAGVIGGRRYTRGAPRIRTS
jgi:hypothetical protein